MPKVTFASSEEALAAAEDMSVDYIYPVDIIETTTNGQMVMTIEPLPRAANEDKSVALAEPEQTDESAEPETFVMNATRLEKHHKARERRNRKIRLNDRRATPRMTATGFVQPDRRQ